MGDTRPDARKRRKDQASDDREDPAEVTVSLKHPAKTPSSTGSSRVTHIPDYVADRYELPPQPKTNGVARNAFARNSSRRARWLRPYLICIIITDLLCAAAASWTAISFIDQQRVTAGFADQELLFDSIAYLALPLAWLLLLWANGAYDRRIIGIGADEFKRVVRATIAIAATVSFAAFGFQKDVSRGTVAVVVLGAMVYIVTARILARKALHRLRRDGRLATYRMLLVGSLPETMFVHKIVTRNLAAGLVPVAIHLSEPVPASRRSQAPVPVYFGRDLVELVRELRADTIAVCGSAGAEPDELRRLAWQLEGTGIDLVVAPQLTDIAGPRVHIRPIEGLPLLHVEEPKLSGMAWLAKNLLDRVAAAIGLLLLSPILLMISLAIRFTDRGPAFFRQLRVGHEGRVFKVWKFRTMYIDAEERKSKLEEQNEGDGMLFKIRDDPRVTRVGKWLRATSMDELPQLINVLKGEMSLVGPRPLPADDGDYLGDVRRRLLVRPGMTGLWQVSGRSDLSWDEAVRLDLYYVDNWSLAYDLSILWRTVGVVLGRKGAY